MKTRKNILAYGWIRVES